MTKVNIREALNQMDKDTNCKYDLVTLYEGYNFNDEEKKEIAKMISDNEDAEVIYDRLSDKFGKDVDFDDDDISDIKESFGDDLIDSQYVDDISDGHWSWDYDDDELANIYGGDTKYDNHPDGVDIDESLNEDTQLKLFDDDMIDDIEILHQWRPEEVEKILDKHGANPNNDTWITGLDLPAAYDEIMSTFRDKYSDYDEIDYGAAKVLGLVDESLNEGLSPQKGDRVRMDHYSKSNNGQEGTVTGRIGELCSVTWDDGTKSKEIKGYLTVIEREGRVVNESKSIKESNKIAYGNEKYKGYMIRQDHKYGGYNVYDREDEMEDSGFKTIDKAKEFIDSLEESKSIKEFGAKARKLDEAEEILYVIKDSHGNQLSRPNADDSELWDRVASMEARGRRGLRVVVYTGKDDSLTEAEDTVTRYKVEYYIDDGERLETYIYANSKEEVRKQLVAKTKSEGIDYVTITAMIPETVPASYRDYDLKEDKGVHRSSRYRTYFNRIKRAIEKGDEETLKRTKEAIMYAPAKELKNSEASELMDMIKNRKINESSLVDKKVSTLGKKGKPMYFTADQLKDAKSKYPEYDFEETTIEYSLPAGQKAYIAKRKTNESKSIKESDEETPYTKEEIERDLKSITHNFTDKEGELKCGFEEEKNFGVEILKQHYKVVEVSGDDRRDGTWYHISFAEPLIDESKSIKEDINDSDEVLTFKRDVNLANDADEIQLLIYELSDGVAEDTAQQAFNENEFNDLETLKSAVITAIDVYLEDNEWLGESKSIKESSSGPKYVTRDIINKTNSQKLKDAYDEGELEVLINGDIWYTERCPKGLGKELKAEMKRLYPDIKYLYGESVGKSSTLSKSIKEDYSDEVVTLRRYLDVEVPDICREVLDLVEQLPSYKISYATKICRDFYTNMENIINNYTMTGDNLKESSYGGAYDIPDDAYFTKEDGMIAANEVAYQLEKEFPEAKLEVMDMQLDNHSFYVVLTDKDGNEFTEEITLDMRKIRHPLDLIKKYAPALTERFIKQIKDYYSEM